MSEKVFNNTFEYKVIYIFTVEDDTHRGLLKVGDATLHTKVAIDHLTPNCRELNQAALKRIKTYTSTAGLTPKLLWSEVATRTVKQKDGSVKLKAFRDHQVHNVLKNSGILPKKLGQSREWFEVDIDTAKKAIEAVKQNYANLSNTNSIKQPPIVFRPEQIDCIKKVLKHFKKSDRFLINAKMRYGKTFVSLEIIKRCAFKKTIIITHRPVVDAGWYEDFQKIFNGTDYIYGSKATGYTADQLLKKKKPFIYFASVQDLRGSALVGGKFDKNDTVFKTKWDCVVVDEAHEGTTTALGEDTVNAIFKEGNGTKLLALSGTPFNILQNYDENSIYTWDYIMEQECKSEWDKLHFGDSNPYDELPEMRIYTYSLGDVLHNSNYITFEDKAFNFKEFFRTFTGDFSVDYADMPQGAEVGDFVHEADVWSFLNLMTKEDNESYYPYSNAEYRSLFKHTLWMVPGIKEAKALKKLMLKHPVFGCGQFNIVNVAGDGDEEEASEEALSKVLNAIKDSGDDYTITLSCGKLTTGVTVKEWTAVFMLAGSYSTSAANYLQTIFRVQSPCNENGRIKETAYVFDFAPDRTLKMVSSAVSISTKAGKTKIEDKQIMGKFLNYCPVIGISGSEMQEYSASKLLQQLKRAYADKVVRNGFDDSNLYNDELFKLQAIDIQKFDELRAIIGSSKGQPKTKDITVNNQGLTDEEYEEAQRLKRKKKKELTPEEKARLKELDNLKKTRRDAISILRGISIRMPLLIYGADIPYAEEITLDKFIDMVDDSSWNEFMPTGVTKEKFKEFQKYYDEEVFIAAGRRIRNIAKEADTLEPTERVIKIASLFSYFKNPDKETVLTPWRVVNMHMSDTLGGWDFWDEQHIETLEQPRFVDRGEITKRTFGKKEAQILEINSKTGLYPLYVTYSCYRTKLANLGDKKLSLEEKQSLWNKTINENIFVICKTPMAKAITNRTLTGYNKTKVNAHCFDDLVNTIQNKPDQFRKRVLQGNFWGKGKKYMKFDAIVGNPPYQEEGANNNKKAPIYPYFWDGATNLSKIVSLIMPARFLFNAGQTAKIWNKKMLNDPHLRVIDYFADPKNVFPSVDIKGGVAILLRDEYSKQEPIKEFIPNKLLRKISQHFDKNAKHNLPSIMYGGRSDLKFNECFLKAYPHSIAARIKAIQKKHPDVTSLSANEEYELKSSSFDVLNFVFINNLKNHNHENYYKILGLSEGKRVYRWIKKEHMTPRYPKNNNIDKYKVFVPESNGSGTFGETLSTPVVAMPGESATPTFISIGCFDTELEAKNLLKYVKTKFTRALLGLCKKTQHNPVGSWSYIPIQDFTSHSDINWNSSISSIDKQLFSKYHLAEDEVDFIETHVQPMK